MAIRIGRRAFLAAGAAGCGGLLARAAAAEGSRADLGIQIYSLRDFPVDQALAHVRDLGLKFVEFYPGMFPVTDDQAAIDTMKKKLADLRECVRVARAAMAKA